MKDNKSISASEVNRYIFCNYQWYYECKYGAAELRRRRAEYLDEMGIAPNGKSPIQRGLAFHVRFESQRKHRLIWKWLRAIMFAAVFIYLLLYFGIAVL